MTDREWDEKLHIETGGRDASFEDDNHHPYEPTPYAVLERIAQSGYLHPGDQIVDYGSGKGRAAFYFHSQLGCSVIGIEREAALYQDAMDNAVSYREGTGLQTDGFPGIWFLCEDAEQYEIPETDAFYFFNPFSVTILRSVIRRILESFYTYGRATKLFFYYPEDECVAYLMTEEELEYFDDISTKDLFGDDPRECVLVFGIG